MEVSSLKHLANGHINDQVRFLKSESNSVKPSKRTPLTFRFFSRKLKKAWDYDEQDKPIYHRLETGSGGVNQIAKNQQ